MPTQSVTIAGVDTVRALLVTVTLLCTACTPTTYDPLRDRPDYVEHVLEDITAMLEGMANAHAADRVVVRDPNFRSGIMPETRPGESGPVQSGNPAAAAPP